MPAVGGETRNGVVGQPDVGHAVDRYAIVVVDADKAPEAQVASKRGCLVAHAFGEVTVAADGVGEVVDDVGAQMGSLASFGHGHTHRGSETLPKRTSGDFDASSVADLGVARRGTAPLTEVLDVIEREPKTTEMQQ